MNWTKKLLMYEWDDLALALLLTAGFWLLGEGVGWIAPAVDKTITRIFPIGLLAVVPPLLGLFAGGFCKRFGRAGGYVLYFSFVLLCVSTGHLLNGTEDLVNVGFGLPLAVSAAVLLIVMAALGAHWLMTGDN